MKLVNLFAFAYALTGIAFAINIPAIGSIDESSCVGGIVTGASTFTAPNGQDVLKKDVKCPNGFPNATRPIGPGSNVSRIKSRQIDECGTSCGITCSSTLGTVTLGDCETLANAIAGSTSVPDTIVVAGSAFSAFFLDTCAFEFDNLQTDELSICKEDFAVDGEVVALDCSAHTGFCTFEDVWSIVAFSSTL